MRRILYVGLGAAVWIGGCRLSADPREASLQPTYDTTSGRLQELAYDSDGDGRLDMKAVMDGTRLLHVEVDENGDGRPDRWEFYGSASGGVLVNAPAPSGFPTPSTIARAAGRDGRVTRTEGFENGRLAWAEEDRSGDGRVDRWETYVDGALTALALDTTGRGRPDRRMTFDGESWTVTSEHDEKSAR